MQHANADGQLQQIFKDCQHMPAVAQKLRACVQAHMQWIQDDEQAQMEEQEQEHEEQAQHACRCRYLEQEAVEDVDTVEDLEVWADAEDLDDMDDMDTMDVEQIAQDPTMSDDEPVAGADPMDVFSE